MDTEALVEAVARVTKKQRVSYAKTQEAIGLLVAELQAAAAALPSSSSSRDGPGGMSVEAGGGAASAGAGVVNAAGEGEGEGEGRSDGAAAAAGVGAGRDGGDAAAAADVDGCAAAVVEMQRRVEQVVETQVTSNARELTGAINKLSKLVERAFLPDIAKAYRDQKFELQVLDGVIAEHMLRSGRFELAATFAREARLELPADAPSPYLEMYNVLDNLRERNLEPALRWVAAHAEDVQASRASGGGLPALEFKLHQLRFLQVLQEDGRNAALAYARQNFGPFSSTRLADVQRLMGCLLWGGRLASSPYAELLQDTSWGDVADEFIREACYLMGQSFESPLLVAVSAGAVALPTLLKLAGVMSLKGQDWASLEELPVEVELGPELQFHSIFSCPVSRDVSTPDNPPMLLPCGHVLAKHSIQKLAKGAGRAFKCPYCPTETSATHCKEIKF